MMGKCLVNGCENRVEILGNEEPVCDECLSWFAIWEARAVEVREQEASA